jgi:hypothetical protein
MTLNTKRQLEVNLFEVNGRYYVRTREVAGVLGVKQPFEFTANIKRVLGDKVILSGDKTETFRDTTEDDNRTTFISTKDLFRFLYCGDICHKMIGAKVKELKDELINYL